MFNLKQLIFVLQRHISQVSWPALITLLLLHAVLTIVFLALAKEEALARPDNFLYYYIVTTSTVGFGDFSPQTLAGKLIVSIFQIPFGLALFGAFLGKIGQSITILLRRHMTGEKSFATMHNHILIFGWNPQRTPKIIDHILGDLKREERIILLCVKDQIEHPFPENAEVAFAKLQSFTNIDELKRVGIAQADRVIVDGSDDNETFTTALRLSKMVNADCHISTYFNDETKVEMLREHCENVECSVSRSVEMLVRSIQDPGSSRIQEELLSTLKGDTQFSVQVPSNFAFSGIEFIKLFSTFKMQYNATVLGIADNRVGDGMLLNPAGHVLVKPGQIVHYIAKQRLLGDDIAWGELG
jgi:voltage-gated potassium channel